MRLPSKYANFYCSLYYFCENELIHLKSLDDSIKFLRFIGPKCRALRNCWDLRTCQRANPILPDPSNPAAARQPPAATRNRESSFPILWLARACSVTGFRTDAFYRNPIYIFIPRLRGFCCCCCCHGRLPLPQASASLLTPAVTPDPRASMAHSLAASFSPAAARRQVRISWTYSCLDLVASLVYEAATVSWNLMRGACRRHPSVIRGVWFVICRVFGLARLDGIMDGWTDHWCRSRSFWWCWDALLVSIQLLDCD